MPATLPSPPPNGTATETASGAGGSVLTRPVQTGEGVDRQRPRRAVTLRRLAIGAAGASLLAVAVWLAVARAGVEQLRLDADRISIASVTDGPFQEFVSVSANVQPLRTVFLDAVVGGQVARRLVDEGDTVSVGQPLFLLENDEVALSVVSQEAQLEEQAASLRQNRLALDKTAVDGAEKTLAVDREIAQLDYDIERLSRERDRMAAMVASGVGSQKDLDALADELAYAQRRRALAARGRDLAERAQRQDAIQRTAQLRDMQQSVGRLRQNLRLVRGTTADLVVRAPVAGQFSALEAEVGELKVRGSRLGQIDVLDEVKLRASLDEHYLARVATGQTASTEIDDVTYALRVRTVYPEVAAGRFEAELVFHGPTPLALRRGQSLRVRIELGSPEAARLLPAGQYVIETGGQYVYAVSADGRTAIRRAVTLGRQNPQFVEVLSGLEAGERVVTSSYSTFGNADMLQFE